MANPYALASIGLSEAGKYVQLYNTVKANKSNYKAMLTDIAEIQRASQINIKNLKDSVDTFANEQALQYLSSGVKLEGTAMRVLSDTYRKGEEEAQEIRHAANRQIDELNRLMKLNKRATKTAIASAIFGTGASAISAKSAMSGKG